MRLREVHVVTMTVNRCPLCDRLERDRTLSEMLGLTSPGPCKSTVWFSINVVVDEPPSPAGESVNDTIYFALPTVLVKAPNTSAIHRPP